MRHEGFHGRAGFGEKPALLVIDVNVGFTDPASPLVCDLEDVVAAIRRLLDEFRRAELPVVYTTVSYDEAWSQVEQIIAHRVPTEPRRTALHQYAPSVYSHTSDDDDRDYRAGDGT